MTNNITILDNNMSPGEVRLIKSIKELYGFEIINETGDHLYIEAEFQFNVIKKLTIRK